jgi:tRNA(fMet)-specific endonuclease VapC
MKYLLDTNIALLYLRNNSLITGKIDAEYDPFGKDNESILCVVSIAELLAMAARNKWSKTKIQGIRIFTQRLLLANINDEAIFEKYVAIELYSQGKLEGVKSPFSARNMSDNDLWIAATASVLGATLLTSDKDFDHLNNVFLTVIWIDPKN